MFLVNNHLGSLAAALIAQGRPYLEITTAVLPSSLTKVLSCTLGFSPRIPVSVYGTDTIRLALEGFLGTIFARIASVKDFSFCHLCLVKIVPDLPKTPNASINAHTMGRSNLNSASLHRNLIVVAEY